MKDSKDHAPGIFKSTVVYLDIKLNGEPQEQAFSDTIEQLGGKVISRL